MSEIEMFRERYDRIIYHGFTISYEVDQIDVQYHFEIPGLGEFTPAWEFPFAQNYMPQIKMVDTTVPPDETTREVIEAMCFHLGMAEMIGYYKTTCPKYFEVRGGKLTKEQAAWWKKVYYKVLCEYLSDSGLDVGEEELFSFTEDSLVCTTGVETGVFRVERKLYDMRFFDGRTLHDPGVYEGCLIPVGGGKASAVTMELLRDEKVVTYHINTSDPVKKMLALYEEKEYDYFAKRIPDKKMRDPVETGRKNPELFPVILAFSSFIAALITGKKYIPSSYEGYESVPGTPEPAVRIPYARSYEFELEFMKYIHTVTDSDILSFSFLRPLNRIQTAGIFSRRTKYLKTFRSCDVGMSKGIWCGGCPKCLLAYITLTPFLPEEQMIRIFGEKLLDKESLEREFRELTGIGEVVPGRRTRTGSDAGLAMKYYVENGGRSLLTDHYQSELLALQGTPEDTLEGWVNDNQVPLTYAARLQEALH